MRLLRFKRAAESVLTKTDRLRNVTNYSSKKGVFARYIVVAENVKVSDGVLIYRDLVHQTHLLAVTLVTGFAEVKKRYYRAVALLALRIALVSSIMRVEKPEVEPENFHVTIYEILVTTFVKEAVLLRGKELRGKVTVLAEL